jgi:uncharacterized protein YndB with AHSA1/START domain
VEINHQAPATAQGEIHIAADPDTVWAVISAIDEWPTWNADVKSARLEGPPAPGSVFNWKAGQSSLVSTLQVVDRPREIGWTDRTLGIRAVHVFRFEPKDGGTLARSEESGGIDREPVQGVQPQDPRSRDPQHSGLAED